MPKVHFQFMKPFSLYICYYVWTYDVYEKRIISILARYVTALEKIIVWLRPRLSGNKTAFEMWWHAQKPDFVFRRNGRVHLNRRGRQFSRLLPAEMCASAVVMLDTPCSEVVWRVLATHSIRQFPLHFPSRASPCATTFQLDSYHIVTPRLLHDSQHTWTETWMHVYRSTNFRLSDWLTQ